MNVYNDRFKDPSDFTFIFVGNIEVDMFYEYLNKYLGSIPSIDRDETWVDVGKEFPPGVINESIYKGMEEKSFVYLTFSDEIPWSEKESNYTGIDPK